MFSRGPEAYLGGATLGALLDAQEALRRAGGDLKIASTNPSNRKIFEITRLDQQLEVALIAITGQRAAHAMAASWSGASMR